MSIKVIGIGDNVVDKYLHTGIMYPGGNALNFAAYARLAGHESVFLGAFGNDDAARHVPATLREHPLHLTPEDLDYIAQFNLVHSSLNGHFETELEKIKQRNMTLSFDFFARGTDDYFKQVCPWVDYGFVSCGALTPDETQIKIRQLYDYGCRDIIATLGYVYFHSEKIRITWQPDYIELVDTLGAGDAFLTGFMLSLLTAKSSKPNEDNVLRAMTSGAMAARHVLNHYGAFGFGKPYSE